MKRILQTLLVILLLNVLCSPNSAQIESGNSEQETLKVGVYLDLSGPTISFGEATRNGIFLATEEFNQTSSKRIELVVEDTRGSPGQARAVVTKLINEDKVHAVLGEIASSNTLAAAPVAQDAKIPMITPAATNIKVNTSRRLYFSRLFC